MNPQKRTTTGTADYSLISAHPPWPTPPPGPVQVPLDHDSVLSLRLSKKSPLGPEYGPDPTHLSLTVKPQTRTRLCLEIESANQKPWRVPSSVVPRYPAQTESQGHDYNLLWHSTESFGFSVVRSSTSEILFDSSFLGITMKDQYLEISTRLSGGNLFGLGENVHSFRRQHGTTTTLWARDCPCDLGKNLYGCHPFYMEVLPSGSAHGVLLMSSNGMDISLAPDGDLLTYKVIGGMLEFYFFTGPTPNQVIQQYTELIGRPCMVPYWSLGYHQCRWGYDTVDKVKSIVDNFKEHQLPLEAIWIDIDYMEDYKCFTFDKQRFPVEQFAKYVKELHGQDKHLVMILDPGIKLQYKRGLYPPYDEGVDKNLFVKRRVTEFEQTEDGTKYHAGDLVDFVGKVWPGKTTFPDWFHPEAQAYWSKWIAEWFKQVPLDGIWIDMNEAASFHDGDCSHIGSSEDRPLQFSDFVAEEVDGVMLQPQHQQQPKSEATKSKTDQSSPEKLHPKDIIAAKEHVFEEEHDPHCVERRSSDASLLAVCEDSEESSGPGISMDDRPPVVYAHPNQPPYTINNNAELADLEYRAISADALHHGGITEYDAHSLYGHMEGIATYNAMLSLQPTKKPFVLSRSTFVSSGRFVSHWLGDNSSSWTDLRASIAGLLNFQLFGIGMVGADVGGFADTASDEILIRWHQLGAFYPFVRNHNMIVNPPQEPYINATLAAVTRSYLDLRYRILPFWYTLFYQFHHEGRMVCSPIWALDPADKNLLEVDDQFLVGESILVSPAVDAGQTSVKGRFPQGRWFNLESGLVEVQCGPDGLGSRVFEMDAPLTKIPLHVRGGSILPFAGIDHGTFIETTAQVKQSALQILVALDETGRAQGAYYHDDDSFESKDGTLVQMSVNTPGVLTVSATAAGDETSTAPRQTRIHSVVIWGVGLEMLPTGKVEGVACGSAIQVEPHQVRVSIVRQPAPETESLQHQRDLSAVPEAEVEVTWDAARAQLKILFRSGEGLTLKGAEGLEVDFTEATVA